MLAGNLSDTSSAEELHHAALRYDEEDLKTPELLNSIGAVFWERYQEGYNLNDLEMAVSIYEKSVKLTLEADPGQGTRLVNLGSALWTRFENTGQRADIDRACAYLNKGLLNEPVGEQRCLGLVNYGGALLERFEHAGL